MCAGVKIPRRGRLLSFVLPNVRKLESGAKLSESNSVILSSLGCEESTCIKC